MTLISLQFACFVCAVVLLFTLSPAKFRPFVLLLSNFVFYGFFSVPILLLIVVCSSFDFAASKFIAKMRDARLKKIVLFSTVAFNLSLLVLFKYSNWIIDIGARLTTLLGIECGAGLHLDLVLPLGISFYTLESVSYLVDVYRGAAPAKNWWHYNFYMMWFPHLLAGPIVRFYKISDQFVNGIKLPSWNRVQEGLLLIMFGCVSKLVVADFAATVADPIFNYPNQQNAFTVAAGIFAFGTELLWDFWGYSQIARGVSLLFNIELPANFNRPFTATNLSDFWQRWHISLSQWLHDYVFLPLGGRTRDFYKSTFAVSLTMLVAGLWHGADTKYLALGLYFAVGIIVYHLYRRSRRQILGKFEGAVINNRCYRIGSWCLTQMFVVTAASFLRVPNLAVFSTMLEKLFHPSNFLQDAICTTAGREILLSALLFFVLCLLPLRRLHKDFTTRISPIAQAPVYACAMVLCWICSAQSTKPFIYFQF